ncbi:LexA family transcriptional regulator [Anaerococcus sp. AGMB09787]|uniref:LexA family protein n=1 Tax=Anaerococcus sp. AGMB09787 TaxID=2922869 RepID=UPI001FAFA236|nr:LexA family transcriptional regulator [Anaerococcus sp. AGMB09787]
MNNKKILSKNLKRELKNRNLTPTEFARIMKYPETTVFNWIHGKSYPRIDKIQEMADFFDIYKSDLTEDKNDLSNIPGVIPVKAIKKIPILGSIVCGYPVWSAENYQGYYPSDPDIFAADFCLYADGDSMIDANIHDGDLVFFKKTPDVENGTIVAALIDGDATLKKFTKTNEAIILSPCNDTYQPIIINKDDGKEVRILGEMIAVLSKRNK